MIARVPGSVLREHTLGGTQATKALSTMYMLFLSKAVTCFVVRESACVGVGVRMSACVSVCACVCVSVSVSVSMSTSVCVRECLSELVRTRVRVRVSV